VQRRFTYYLLSAQGWKGKEHELMSLDLDEKIQRDEIEKYGFIKVTQIEH